MVVSLPPPAILFVEEPAQFEIRDGIASCTVRSGELVLEVRCTPNVLAASVGNASMAYSEYLGDGQARVVRMPTRRARKH